MFGFLEQLGSMIYQLPILMSMLPYGYSSWTEGLNASMLMVYRKDGSMQTDMI